MPGVSNAMSRSLTESICSDDQSFMEQAGIGLPALASRKNDLKSTLISAGAIDHSHLESVTIGVARAEIQTS
jgi:hypothetical protein